MALTQEQRDQLNQLLSLTTLKFDGNQGFVDGQADPAMTQLMGGAVSPQQAVRAAPQTAPQLPQNFIRNERTGEVVDMGPSRQSAIQPDYNRPGISIPNSAGNAYYLKGSDNKIVRPYGQIVSLTRPMTPDEERRYLLLQNQRLENQKLQQELTTPKRGPETAYERKMGEIMAEAKAAELPNSKQYKEIEETHQRNKIGREADRETVANMLQTIEGARGKINSFSTSAIGQIFRNIGGTDALDLQELLEPLRSNLATDKLQQMRDRSKTGGALGSVAVRELELLMNAKASLNTAQSGEQLRKNLDKIQEHYIKWQEAIDAAEKAGEFRQRGSTVPNAPKKGDIVGGYVYMGGDPSNPSSWRQ
jgi:hypothetical protein